MTENEKLNGVLAMLKGVFKGKKEDCGDIVTQAEKIISDYINKRRNEIINKYCRRRSPLVAMSVLGASAAALYLAYILFI